MVIRLDPFREVETLSRQLNQVFDELANTAKSNWVPRAELLDSAEHLTLRVGLPGINAKEIDIDVTRESVTISGSRQAEKQSDDQRYYWSEFSYGKFHRTFSLPVAVRNDLVQAEYRDGVLTLTLPKVEEASKKVVKVKLTEANDTQAQPLSE